VVKRMQITDPSSTVTNLDALYAWDTEGRMTMQRDPDQPSGMANGYPSLHQNLSI